MSVPRLSVVAFLSACASTCLATPPVRGETVSAPMECSRGPDDQRFRAVISMPATARTGERVRVRIDSVPSGTIEHTGLNYMHSMRTDYVLPAGTRYVDGSARIVPNTGTPNVRDGARLWHDAQGLHFELAGRVQNGSSYTPPSFTFEFDVTAPAGRTLAIRFTRYRMTTNVLLLGNLEIICTPRSRTLALASLRVVPSE